MSTNRKYVQAQPFSLAGSGTFLADTVITLTAFNQISANGSAQGAALSMTDFGTKGYGTLEPGSQLNEEQISFTGVTTNSDGTVNITGIKSVGFVAPYTETTGLAKLHAGGVQFVISNDVGFYNDFANKHNEETIDQVWTFDTGKVPISLSVPTLNNELANKTYVDNVALSGAPDGNTTTKGIYQAATVAQQGTHTSTGSTGALLVPVNGNLVSTSAGSGDASKIPTLGAAGVLDVSFMAPTIAINVPGAITAYGGSSAPTGWLLCDGASLLRATYAALFAVLGTTYGSADGTHFNVPDLRANVPVGYKASDPNFGTLGGAVGAVTHSISTAEMPAHTHTIGATPTYASPGSTGGTFYTGGTTTTSSAGGGSAMSLLQPSLTINFIIKT